MRRPLPIDHPELESGGESAGRGLVARGLPLSLLAAAVTAGGLTVMMRGLAPSAPPPPLVRAIERPTALGIAPLRLAEPGIDPVRVEPGRIDGRTGYREDILGRGQFEAVETPILRLAVTRGAGAEKAPSLFVLLARRAGHAPPGGLPLSVMRTGVRGTVATRFGAVETLEAILSGPTTRTCTGFVSTHPGLRIDGYLCGPLGGAPAAQSLACTLDALDLDDPTDPLATDVFRKARARSDCPTTAANEPPNRTGAITRR
jgi:hypothetical protein